MKRFLIVLLAMVVGVVFGRLFDGVSSTAEAVGEEKRCAARNGDVNGDGDVDISDAITILNHLFSGNPEELLPMCTPKCTTPSGLPDTGLTMCWDQFGNEIDCEDDTCPGQDGFYATGCPTEGRFVDNGDGTVTDNCTGLMWEQFTGNDGNQLDWCSALAYCENLELAEHDDWRLPNARELLSIVDYGRVTPSIDPVFGAASAGYWSSTSIVENGRHDRAKTILFNFGFAWFADKASPRVQVCTGGRTSDLVVRAVRSGDL